jgi:hypothetical protein
MIEIIPDYCISALLITNFVNASNLITFNSKRMKKRLKNWITFLEKNQKRSEFFGLVFISLGHPVCNMPTLLYWCGRGDTTASRDVFDSVHLEFR